MAAKSLDQTRSSNHYTLTLWPADENPNLVARPSDRETAALGISRAGPCYAVAIQIQCQTRSAKTYTSRETDRAGYVPYESAVLGNDQCRRNGPTDF